MHFLSTHCVHELWTSKTVCFFGLPCANIDNIHKIDNIKKTTLHLQNDPQQRYYV